MALRCAVVSGAIATVVDEDAGLQFTQEIVQGRDVELGRDVPEEGGDATVAGAELGDLATHVVDVAQQVRRIAGVGNVELVVTAEVDGVGVSVPGSDYYILIIVAWRNSAKSSSNT